MMLSKEEKLALAARIRLGERCHSTSPDQQVCLVAPCLMEDKANGRLYLLDVVISRTTRKDRSFVVPWGWWLDQEDILAWLEQEC